MQTDQEPQDLKNKMAFSGLNLGVCGEGGRACLSHFWVCFI